MVGAKRKNPSQGANTVVKNGTQPYVGLERRLVLLAWLNSLFGYESNEDLLEGCKEVGEGYDADGHSYLYHHLLARGSKVQIPVEDLAHYDENIRQHLVRINRNRREPITLRYFQYLAALYTEIVLDRLFNHKERLLADLNAFVAQRNSQKRSNEPKDDPFTEEDLTKLAYWMATGSGKTLLLHLNYYQFLHYNREPLGNVLLITPNEGLSEQHLRELELSGIPARRFDLSQSGPPRTPNQVQVIEITKLVGEKRGGGVSVPVEAFEGRNLIFVDEGHKGAGGEAWRKYRNELGKKGFAFEYSATFGQALSAAGNHELTKEYGKAIVFDYSYRYFYGDGFGKGFRILNLKEKTEEENTHTLLLGNLLAFYQQLRLYEDRWDDLRPYNLEKPLWVFVGGTVNAVYTENKRKRSDVLTVVRFLHRVLAEGSWAVETIKKLLEGTSGLRTQDGADVFRGYFPYLREKNESAEELYEDILKRVFHAPAGGGLHLASIGASRDEIGLKAAGAEQYFGVIYIGDTSAFKKLVEEKAKEITWEEEAIRGSLFDDINLPDSPIHVLVGARKFMEGWNSWRVATMGLLNIGRNEGPQIIQLFGRGVRLKGKDMSLKRSAFLPGPHPEHIGLLETLNVFAVRANYMAQFREYLEREGVATEQVEERRVPICIPKELPTQAKENRKCLQDLYILRRKEDADFQREKKLVLREDAAIKVRLDLSTRLEVVAGVERGVKDVDARSGEERKIEEPYLRLVDWERVYLDLLAYKAQRGWHNLVLTPETPQELMRGMRYTLIADEEKVRPRTFAERHLLQETVTALLRKYMEAFYRHHREAWESANMEYRPLDGSDPNLAFESYEVWSSQREFVEILDQLLKQAQDLYCKDGSDLPCIHFDRHLYQPLLVEKGGSFKSTPPALKESEKRFVEKLREYWKSERSRCLNGRDVYLLRNLSRGRGVGFFEGRGFYPDFILWVVDWAQSVQHLAFVEPHGMMYAPAYQHDPKAQLHKKLRELQGRLNPPSGWTIYLDAFIFSVTPFEELRKRYGDGSWDMDRFATEAHILFLDDPECMKKLFVHLLECRPEG